MITAKHQELLATWNVLKNNVRKLLCNADYCMIQRNTHDIYTGYLFVHVCALRMESF